MLLYILAKEHFILRKLEYVLIENILTEIRMWDFCSLSSLRIPSVSARTANLVQL